MASARVLEWLDRAAWTLIYGGLFLLVLGLATGASHRIAGWSLGVIGGVLAAAGVVILLVRARLTPASRPGAQSSVPTPREKR